MTPRRLPKLLSKTKIMRGYRCLKSIYYTLHRPELEPPVTPEQQALFDQGNDVGVKAREYYPGGVLVDCKPWEFVDALKKTRELLKQGTEHIYEAAFEYKGCYARADILKYNPATQRWTLLEVKAATKVKPEHLHDVGLQAWIIANSGLKLERICLLHLNPECRYPDLSNLFVEADVTDALRESYKDIAPKLNMIFTAIRADQPPEVDIGPQCSAYGRDCEFKSTCWGERAIPEVSVFDLPRLGEKAWDYYRRGQIALNSVDTDGLDEMQTRIVNAHTSGRRFMNQKSLQAALATWNFPMVFLDFETINPAIPRFDGCSPYQQVPFQFSVHVWPATQAPLAHREFLFDADGDPRSALIPELLSACAGEGSIVAYYARFEMGVIEELANFSPPHAHALRALLPRFVDPLPVIREHLYDPAFTARFSLKNVAPALLGEAFSYEGMRVSDGGAAQRAYARLVREPSGPARDELRQALLEYCHKDTLAMVDTVKWLFNATHN